MFTQDILLPVDQVASPACFALNTTTTSTTHSVFDIPIEVLYKNMKRDVSRITSISLFAHVLHQIAVRMDAVPS